MCDCGEVLQESTSCRITCNCGKVWLYDYTWKCVGKDWICLTSMNGGMLYPIVNNTLITNVL